MQGCEHCYCIEVEIKGKGHWKCCMCGNVMLKDIMSRYT